MSSRKNIDNDLIAAPRSDSNFEMQDIDVDYLLDFNLQGE